MTVWIIAGLVFFSLMGMAYVVGFDQVKRHAPAYQPHFYLLAATVRMILTLTMIGLLIFTASSRDEVIPAVIAWLVMYVVMMVVTLTLRH